MFNAVGLKLEGDHLDLSYHDPSSWTPACAEFESPNQWFVVGDPDSGPTVMLGAMPAFPKDLWFDSHFHGSDQFRAVIKGEFLVQRRRMKAGDFGYQESGMPYREGVSGAQEGCWMFAIHGNWRGARSTRVRSDGSFVLPRLSENQLDRWAETPDDPCWWNVPGGNKGIVALKTTLGPIRGGFVWGNFDDAQISRPLAQGVTFTAGLFGLPETGPILLTIKAAADCVAAPAAVYGTEIVCAVIRGSAKIGDKLYKAGELRIQNAGVPLDAVVSGPDGLNMVYLIADRRHRPKPSNDDPVFRPWQETIESIYSELSPSSETAAA
jgi:hypothetical protein